jgi:hypothetical protein
MQKKILKLLEMKQNNTSYINVAVLKNRYSKNKEFSKLLMPLLPFRPHEASALFNVYALLSKPWKLAFLRIMRQETKEL